MAADIRDNLRAVEERVRASAERARRSADDVLLIAVTKTQPLGRILAAIEAGVTNLGENRVQEATEKLSWRGVMGTAAEVVPKGSVALHLIGGLQRNKVRQAARLFDCIHSVDRPALLGDLDAAVSQERETPMPVLLEVNVTGEASKAGVTGASLPRLAEALGSCPNLHGVGLMTVARMDAGEGELRHTFATLRMLLTGLQGQHPGDWRHLSMGMSDDFEYAIEEGATMIRVGRAIFGERLRPE